jgi:hypothetical protein
MLLSDLIAGRSSSVEQQAEGLGSLVAQPATARMTLVQAMNAIRNGTLARPVDDGSLAAMIPAALPPLPQPAPQPQQRAWLDREAAEARAQRAAEMKTMLRAKMFDLQNSADVERRDRVMQKLSEAEQQLNEWR